MSLKAFLKFSVASLLSLSFALLATLPARAQPLTAQEDTNAQYITILSGKLLGQGAGETRDIEVPVEVGVLRLFFNLRWSGDIKMEVISPVGRPIALDEANISVTNADGRRTVSIWDPRPGPWKLRLTGTGDFTASASAQGEVYVCCVQFFARNLIHQLDKFQPVRGSRHQAQVYASGFNIEAIEFQLISEQGELIAPLKIRQSDYSNPYNFTLLMETPDRPFRIRARGRDTNGKPFQRVLYWLVRPVETEAATPPDTPGITITPQGVTPQGVTPQGVTPQQQQSASTVDWEKTAVAGEYKIVRAQVTEWSDEPLLSEKGNPIGIRLKYSIRFPVDGQYSPFPQAFPERITSTYTGALSLRVHRSNIDPLPEGLQNAQQLFFGGRPIFKGGVTYKFTVEMVPGYANYNEPKKSFCLMTKSYSQQGVRERFDREVMSEIKVRYRLSVSGTNLEGRNPVLTENSYAPSAWYQGFLKDGVIECP